MHFYAILDINEDLKNKIKEYNKYLNYQSIDNISKDILKECPELIQYINNSEYIPTDTFGDVRIKISSSNDYYITTKDSVKVFNSIDLVDIKNKIKRINYIVEKE